MELVEIYRESSGRLDHDRQITVTAFEKQSDRAVSLIKIDRGFYFGNEIEETIWVTVNLVSPMLIREAIKLFDKEVAAVVAPV